MKRVFLIILVLTSTFTFSQKKAKLGIKAGVNYSTITNANFDAKTGLYAGMFLHVKFSDFFTIQPEIVYSNQGGVSTIFGDENVNIHYISLAFVSKFFVSDSGFHLMISSGFDFDYDDTLIGMANGDGGNDITFIDFTLGGGVGYEFENGIILEAKYKHGMIDVFSGFWHDFDSELYEDHSQFNSVFQFGMAYKFDLKKTKK